MKRWLIILVALLVCGCSANVATRARPAVAAKPDTSHFLIGAAAASAAQFQQATGVQPDILEHYARIGTDFSVNFAGNSVPLIQLMPYGESLASIAGGSDDSWLISYARAVAAYQRPVVLGFAPEANGDWYPWGDGHVSAADYIAAWRHVVTVFRDQGAGNVTWIWTVNVDITASADNPSNAVASPTPWWPGDRWVDWIGLDGYFYRSAETFNIVFGTTLAQVRALTRKPVMISETAVAPAAGKAGKIPGLFAGASESGMIGLTWFDLRGNRDWPLEDDPAALAAFRAEVAAYTKPTLPPTPTPTGTQSSPPASPTATPSPPASPTTPSSPPTQSSPPSSPTTAPSAPASSSPPAAPVATPSRPASSSPPA